jgi:non-specific serine/threonine protein kinase
LALEQENLRRALAWSLLEPDRAENALRLVTAMWEFWYHRSYLSEGSGWLEAALEQTRREAAASALLRTPLWAKALCAAGALTFHQGDLARAASLLEESMALARELGSRTLIAEQLLYLGHVARARGDLDAAVAFLEECRSLSSEERDLHGITWSTLCLGAVAHSQGEHTRARALCEQALASARLWRRPPSVAWSLLNLGDVALSEERYDESAALYRESLILFQDQGNRSAIAHALEGLAGAAAGRAEPRRATLLLGAAEAVREAIRAPLKATEYVEHGNRIAHLRTVLGQETFAHCWKAGRGMTLEQAILHALEDAYVAPADAKQPERCDTAG